MKIYSLNLKENWREFPGGIIIPKIIDEIRINADTQNITTIGLCEKVFKSFPNIFKNTELEIEAKFKSPINSIERLESYNGGHFLSSIKFKNFSQKENLGFNFYPCKLLSETRYITTNIDLKLLHDFYCDRVNSEKYSSGKLRSDGLIIYDDIIQKLGWKVLTDITQTQIFVTEEIKEKFEIEGFNFTYEEIKTAISGYSDEELNNIIPELDKQWNEFWYEKLGNKNEIKKQEEFLNKIYKEFESSTILN